MKNLILVIIIGLLCTTGCAITGSIDKTTTTTKIDEVTQKPVTVVEHCEASYMNSTWGTASDREVHGCEAGGAASGVDNTQMIQIPLAFFQFLGNFASKAAATTVVAP